jgi:hypothetical protein
LRKKVHFFLALCLSTLKMRAINRFLPMKTVSLRLLRILGFATFSVVLLGTSAFAAPADEITQAVTANGAHNVRQSDQATFLQGYRSVLKKTTNEQLPSYLTAAIHLRPDLAGPITEASVRVWATRGHATGGKEILGDKEISCDEIDGIIRAAVLADPPAAPAIVHAAVAAAPYARRCIVAAAIAADPSQRVAIERAAASAEPEPPGEGPGGGTVGGPVAGGGGIGTINPANIGGGTGGLVVSPTGP